MRLMKALQALCLIVSIFVLTGCLPVADFSVTPATVVAGQTATFDAGLSSASASGTTLVSYEWDFGDGSKGSGKTASHTYAKSGEYYVALTVKDSKGQTDIERRKLKVQDAVADASVTVLVRSSQGVTLTGAKVTIGGVSANADSDGVAKLAGVSAGSDIVVQVSKTGFVTQAVRTAVSATTGASLQVLLQPVKETHLVSDITLAQVIMAETLGASLTLPENAFVDAAGKAATGKAMIHLTPWDINGSDLQAMPGNGQAKDASGAIVDLISAGMMSVEVFDAQGNKLQLASGKKAKIRMDLPYESIGGTKLQAGSEIPMWHFDETQGLWVEEGKGTVVESQSSPVGLAVEAEVAHFSNWNWDFKLNNPNTLQVRCVDANNQDVACYAVANVTLGDGSKLTKSVSLPVGGLTIINLPVEGVIDWEATTADGLLITASSGVSGSVVIKLGAPLTSNFVSCQKSGVATACEVTLTDDSGNNTLTANIPAEGAWMKTAWVVSNLNWVGLSGMVPSLDGQSWERSSGQTTSGVSGNVTIALDSGLISYPVDRRILVKCVAGDWGGGAVPTSCNILMRAWRSRTETSRDVRDVEILNVPLGQVVSFNASSVVFNGVDFNATYAPKDQWSGYYVWGSVFDLVNYPAGEVIVLTIGGV